MQDTAGCLCDIIHLVLNHDAFRSREGCVVDAATGEGLLMAICTVLYVLSRQAVELAPAARSSPSSSASLDQGQGSAPPADTLTCQRLRRAVEAAVQVQSAHGHAVYQGRHALRLLGPAARVLRLAASLQQQLQLECLSQPEWRVAACSSAMQLAGCALRSMMDQPDRMELNKEEEAILADTLLQAVPHVAEAVKLLICGSSSSSDRSGFQAGGAGELAQVLCHARTFLTCIARAAWTDIRSAPRSVDWCRAGEPLLE